MNSILTKNFLKQVTNRFHGELGLTLFEALVAVAILGAIGVSLIQGLYTSNKTIGIIEAQSTARVLISEHIESIRRLPYSANYSNAGENITIPDQYSVVIEVEGSNDDIVWQTANGTETLQRIKVTIHRGGRPVMRICTFRTPRTT